jgi:hypothetical protein
MICFGAAMYPSTVVIAISYTAIGVIAIDSDVKENVLPDAHAWDAVNAAVPFTEPAAAAVHKLICDSVSVVPPFVHDDAILDIAFDPPEAAAIVACTRAVDPAAAAVAPAAPGSAVWSFT